MSNIKISGISATQLLANAELALANLTSSNMRQSKVRKFVTDMFELKNEHLIPNLCSGDVSTSYNAPAKSQDDMPFQATKVASFRFNGVGYALESYNIDILIDGVIGSNTINVYQSKVCPDTGGVADAMVSFNNPHPSHYGRNDNAMENYRAALNYAFDLRNALNKVKDTVQISELVADGFDIAVSGYGLMCQFDPTDLISELRDMSQDDMMNNIDNVELKLLSLAHINVFNGYMHSDVVKAIEQLTPLFGVKFNALKINR